MSTALISACLMLTLWRFTSSQNVTISPNTDVDLVAGSTFENLICYIPAGDTITQWLRDGAVLDINNNDRLSVREIGGIGQVYRLVITNTQQSDSGRYQCRTSSQVSPMSGNVNVIDLQITAPLQQQLVYQTDDIIMCSSVDGALSNWYTGGASITANGTYSIENDGLHITSIQLYHQRQYECEYTILSPAVSRSVFIDVTVVAPSMVLSVPSNTSVQKGSDFGISFNYLAIPQPNFTWYINDVLHQPEDGTTTSGTHTVMFTSASEEGWYRCVVENELGRAEYRVFVDILVPPMITTLDDQIAAMGTNLVLNCLSQGDVPLNYQWRFSGGALDSDPRVSGLTSNTLTITGITETDNGTYTCMVQNDHGMDSANAIAIVIGTPAALSSVSSSGITATTAVITWTVTTNTINRPVDHVIIHYHITNSSDVLMVNVSADMTSVTLQGLVPDTLYTFNVAASNLAGNSPLSSDQGFLTSQGAPKVASVTGSSNAYNSVQVSVTLLYNGGSPITAITIEFRVAGTTNVLSQHTTTYPTTQANATATSWSFSITGLQYDQSGYEVIAKPSNSIGQGDGTASEPIILFTALPGKPNTPSLQEQSVSHTSMVISCSTNDLGQPPINTFVISMRNPIQRNNSLNLASYMGGTLRSVNITNLTADTTYTFVCYAGNVAGVGEQSDPAEFKTMPAPAMISNIETGDGNSLGIIIGVVCAVVLVVLLLSIILLYAFYVKKSKEERYLVSKPPTADENPLKSSPGVMRRQFNLENSVGGPLAKHQVGDAIEFNTNISSAHFSRQASSGGNISRQTSGGVVSSFTRQYSNHAASAPVFTQGSYIHPHGIDSGVIAHYHISNSSSETTVTTNNVDDEDESRLSYPPSAFATNV